MRRRVALNVSLALLVAGLAAFALLAPPRQESDAARRLAPAPDPDVRSIQVDRAGKPRLQFARAADGWSLRAPVLAPAHPRRIRDLLALPTLTTGAPLAITDQELPRFGLKPPLATLSMGADTFAFGITDGLDGRRYVRYRGQVLLTPDAVYPLLTQAADFFIDTRLLREGLRPERIAAPHRSVWRKDGAWFSEPAQAPGEPSAESIASAWESAEALAAFSGTDAADAQKITLTFARGITIVFDIMERDGKVELLRRDLDLRYLLDPGHARALMVIPGATAADPAAS